MGIPPMIRHGLEARATSSPATSARDTSASVPFGVNRDHVIRCEGRYGNGIEIHRRRKDPSVVVVRVIPPNLDPPRRTEKARTAPA